MHHMCRISLVLLVAIGLLLTFAIGVGADPVLKYAAFVAPPRDNPSLKALISNTTAISSVVLSPRSRSGWIDVDIWAVAKKATHVGSRIYASPNDLVGAGSVILNGCTICLTSTNTVQNLIAKINAVSQTTEVVASHAAGSGITLTSTDYGSDHGISLADPDMIVNDGYSVAKLGADAGATITYDDFTTEVFDAGKGLQLIGNYSGLIINLTDAGNKIAGYWFAVQIVPDNLVGCGDHLEVVIDIANDLPIRHIICTTPGTSIPPYSGGITRVDFFSAASTPGQHKVTFLVEDSAGVYTLTAHYTTVPYFGTTVRSACEPIMDVVSGSKLFKVCGQITTIDADSFYLRDGSGKQLKVKLPYHGCSDGDRVIVNGQLNTGTSPRELLVHGISRVVEDSRLSAVILDTVDISSASFAPGTPAGLLSVNLTRAAMVATLETAHVYATPYATVANGGEITINDHVFSIAAVDTVTDVISAINNADLDVTAQFSPATSRVVLTGSGYGTDQRFTYMETADILDGGPRINAGYGQDARATVTYSDGSTEIYGAGKGLQLIGDTSGGIINLTEVGGTCAANHPSAIGVVSAP